MVNQNPLHPKIPEEFKDETNYKNIPSQYLSKDIPQGRGMIKWSPFATTPYLYEDINRQIKKQSFKQMPVLTEEQILENDIKVHQCLILKKECVVIYFKEHNIHHINCIINKIIENEKKILVYLLDYNLEGKLLFDRIIDVYVE